MIFKKNLKKLRTGKNTLKPNDEEKPETKKSKDDTMRTNDMKIHKIPCKWKKHNPWEKINLQ